MKVAIGIARGWGAPRSRAPALLAVLAVEAVDVSVTLLLGATLHTPEHIRRSLMACHDATSAASGARLDAHFCLLLLTSDDWEGCRDCARLERWGDWAEWSLLGLWAEKARWRAAP